ncbi:MAG TPA: hypothetical protein EYP43_01075, partial [Thermoplasmata archaeon]|nr:hypothetical protein [Thermoplasmata archaeon]
MTRWTSPSLLAGAFLVILTVPTALLISIPGQTGARMVIAEYFSHSQCPDCHAANVRLSGIYDDDDRDFVYVALITDKNRQAKGRFVDYVPIPEEQRYPTVEFDGGYREEEGKRTTDVYRGDIDDCAAREVPGVDLDVSMDQRGADSFRLHVRARLMDGDSIHVRVLAYVVENVSRYRDADGRSYRFGLLDIAIDANITLGGDWWSNDTLWVGSDHRDSRGDDFGDAEYANLNVIVGVFLNETGQPRRAVRAAMAVPPVLTILSDGGNVTGQFEIRARVEGDRVRGTTISTVEYRVDDAPWTTMISTGGGAYSAVWNSTDVDNGTHVIIVRAVDGTGTSSRATITVNVSNDDFEPP